MTEQTKEILDLRRNGLSHKEIAKRTGKTLKSVQRACENYGVTCKSGKVVYLWKDLVTALRKKGLSYNNVAILVSKPYDTIARFCKDNKLTYKNLGQKRPYTVTNKVRESRRENMRNKDVSYLHAKRGPNEKTKAIIELRKQQKTYEEICQSLGCTMNSVRGVVLKYNVAYKDIEDSWKNEVESLRKSGLDYIDVSNRLGIPKDTIEVYCRSHNLGYGDLGDSMKKEHYGSLLRKNRVLVDWNDKVLKHTSGAFELIECLETERSRERRLVIRCTKCGLEKNISSISLRGTKNKVHCSDCFAKARQVKQVKKKRVEEIDKQIREANKLYKRGKTLIQMEMRFCDCGQILPWGKRVCDECKRKTMRENERRKDYERRARIKNVQDKDITLQKLFDKADGVCYLCGKVCDWGDFQRINKVFIVGGSYPTIEHVKPLCKGGTHTWNNVKLACHACNSKKGRKYSPPGRSN